jgi:hypothetical protein
MFEEVLVRWRFDFPGEEHLIRGDSPFRYESSVSSIALKAIAADYPAHTHASFKIRSERRRQLDLFSTGVEF